MNGLTPRRSYVFGFHPTARGFGWVAFEGPFAAYDWGIFTATGDKNTTCLRKLEELFDRITPETLVIEAFDKQSSLRSDRIRRLCLSVVSLATDRGADVAVFTRSDIQSCFATVGARTRDEIANAVAQHVPALEPRLPKRRGAGDSEDKRLSLFCAGALVLTYYHFGAAQILDDLRDR
jgi:hypothetical protein